MNNYTTMAGISCIGEGEREVTKTRAKSSALKTRKAKYWLKKHTLQERQIYTNS